MGFKRRERILVVLTVAVLTAWAGDQLVLSPLLETWQSRDQRMTQLEASLVKGRALATRQDSLRNRWKDMVDRSLSDQAPIAESEVLRAVSRWADQSRLVVTSQKPRWIREEGAPTRLELHATGQGSIDQVARFLYELEGDPLAFRIEEVEIAARDARGETLSVDVRFTGLVLQEKSS